MMAYTVIKHFVDLQDGNYSYGVGDAFPRAGVNVSEARIAELSGSNNKQGVPLIQKVKKPRAEKEAVVVEEAPKKPRKKKTAEE